MGNKALLADATDEAMVGTDAASTTRFALFTV